jgi:integrase/recombinase XerD
MNRAEGHRPSAASPSPDPQGMTALLEQFLQWLQIRNYSPRTVVSRRRYLGYFLDWADQRGLTRPSEITKPILERYQRSLFLYRKANGDPLTFRSQFNRLLPVRAWFKWLAKQNHILYNPASELELPKLEHRLPKHVLTAAEVEVILNLPDLRTPLGLRDRAMLETLYATGIRRLELINLRVYDIDSDRNTVMVRQGKNKKDRIIPISPRALCWIDRYLREVRPALEASGQAEDSLFLDEQGQPLEAEKLSYRVGRYVQAANLGKTGSCHLFRHTLATLMLENGADIRFIQAMLGHARLDTTAIYTQVAIRQLKAVYEATHPGQHEANDGHGSLDV